MAPVLIHAIIIKKADTFSRQSSQNIKGLAIEGLCLRASLARASWRNPKAGGGDSFDDGSSLRLDSNLIGDRPTRGHNLDEGLKGNHTELALRVVFRRQ